MIYIEVEAYLRQTKPAPKDTNAKGLEVIEQEILHSKEYTIVMRHTRSKHLETT